MLHSRRVTGYVFACALALAALWSWSVCAAIEPSGVLTFVMLNVGQGDALYIESPSGVRVLLDGGPDASVLQELSKVMPFSARTLDAVIESHPDADHIVGLVDVVERYDVGSIIEPGIYKTSATAVALEQDVIDHGLKRYIARRGMVVDLGSGAILQVLYPNDAAIGMSRKNDNDGVIVARLVYGKTSILLTADAPFGVENKLIAMEQNDGVSELSSDILKVGHHGSKASTGADFLADVHPSLALISVGAENKYGHPTPETLNALATANVPVLRTDKDGAIVLRSNGKVWWRER